MKSTTVQKALAFTLSLVFLFSGSLCAQAAKSQPKTAEELGYLPAEELLAEDGNTIRFNDEIVRKALEQQYPHLMEADGSFLKASLKEVSNLIIGVDVTGEDRTAYWDAYNAAGSAEDFVAEVTQVDLSVLQFCTKLEGLRIVAQRVQSLAALTPSKARYKFIDFIGVKDLNLQPCPSFSNLSSLELRGCEVQSYEPLFKCKKLDLMELAGPGVTDIRFITELPKLTYLWLREAPNADLAPLLEKKSFDGLSLDMKGATADDIRWQLAAKCKYGFYAYNLQEITPEIVEKYLSKLKWMDISYTEMPAQAMDFSALQGLKKLDDLSFFQANIESFAFLAELSHLTSFSAYDSYVKDADELFSAPKLKYLHLGHNSIENWPSFEAPVAAKKLSQIVIVYCGLTDLSFVNGLSLKYLWLNDNEIMDISLLSQTKKIEKLSLSGNPVADFSPLTEIKGLKLVQHSSSQTLPELKKVEIVQGDEDMWFY